MEFRIEEGRNSVLENGEAKMKHLKIGRTKLVTSKLRSQATWSEEEKDDRKMASLLSAATPYSSPPLTVFRHY